MKKTKCFSCAGIGYFRTGHSFLTNLTKCPNCKGKGVIITKSKEKIRDRDKRETLARGEQ